MGTVAVVIPVYATPENHRLDFLGQTLRSMQQQTHNDLVALVVNDSSTADVEGFVEGFGFGKARYVRRTRSPADLKTASNALNFGIDLCLAKSSDVLTRAEADSLSAVAYLHSDDLLPPESVGKRLAALTHYTAFVYANMVYIDAQNRLVGIKKWKDNPTFNSLSCFPHHTTMWSFEFVGQLKAFVADRYGQDGVFDARLSHDEDRDCSLSSIEATALTGKTIVSLPAIAYAYRIHRHSITGDNISEEYFQSQSRLVDTKHFSSQELRQLRLITLFQRLLSDLPWSLGYSLPESIKKRGRPIRDSVKRAMFTSTLLNETERHDLEGLMAMLPSLPQRSSRP